MSTTTTNYALIKPAVNNATDQDLWGTYLNTNLDTIDTQLKTNADAIAAVSGAVAVGVVLPYAGSTAPSGYLLCYGQAISRTTYSDLFAITSTTYGAGDGSTTFNVPDLRGRVPAGQDDMGGTSANRLTDQSGGLDGDTLGDTGGSEQVTLTSANIPSVAVTFSGLARNDGDSAATPLTYPVMGPSTTGSASGASWGNTTAGGTPAINNVQPTIILNYIIRTGV